VTEPSAPGLTLRFANLEDVDAVASLHASRISEGFLVTLGPAFLRRLYRRVVLSHGAFLLVADDTRTVCGFIAVAESTRALYREYLLRDGFKVAWADDGPPTSPITHSDRFVLVDRTLRIRGYYHGTDADDLARLVRDAVRLRDGGVS